MKKNTNWKTNRTFRETSIRTILKRNYKIDDDLIDIHALYDMNITHQENLNNILEFLKAQKPPIICPCCGRSLTI